MNSIAPSVVHQMTCLYVFVDNYLKEHPAQAAWRRSNNDAPEFTDAEVITLGLLHHPRPLASPSASCITLGLLHHPRPLASPSASCITLGLLQGVFGCATLKKTYQMVASNWRSAFPHLCSYGQWNARLHALSALVGQLLQAAVGVCGLEGRLYMMDGLPIRVCKSIRHGRVRLLHEEGAYFGKSSTGWFFGFKLHALVHHSGLILAAILTPANFDEREAALALCLSVDGGIVLADSGYRSKGDWLGEALAEDADMLLIHPADAGEKGQPRRGLISSVRERVETCFSGLWQRFIDRNLSRSWQGLWSSLKLKMLHYNLCQAGIIPA